MHMYRKGSPQIVTIVITGLKLYVPLPSFSNIVPDVWGTVEVTAQGVQTEGQEFNLTCVVTTVRGLPQDSFLVSWLGPKGGEFHDNVFTQLGPANSTNVTTTSVLVFKHLNSSHGGIYTCKAIVNVSGLNIPPPLVQEYHLIVTSKTEH